MKITVSKYTPSNLYFLGVLFALAICTYIAMPDMDNMAEAGTGLSFLATLGLTALQIPLLVYIFYKRYKTQTDVPRLIPLYVLYYTAYFIWMTVTCALTDDVHNIFGKITSSMTILVFPILMSCSYFRARTDKLDVWFYSAVLFILFCITIQYINLYNIANQLADEASHIGVSYFPLFILPILLLPSSFIVKIASIAITALIIISSIKRGGLIAMGASLIVYVFVKQIVTEISTTKKFVIIGAVIVLMAGVFYYLGEVMEENNVIERISNIKDDGGSDRDILWKDTYHNIINRDLGFQLIGNGYRSAQKESTMQLPAHNDALEIWYDFGIIGLVMYGIAFVSLCLYTLRLIKRKSRYAPHMSMILTYYFILSMISIVILNFWMALFTFSIGIVGGLADRELAENKVKIQPHETTSKNT